MKYITVLFQLINSKGRIVKGQAIIKDGLNLSTFSDPNLAREIYEYDIDNGEDVSFNEKHNAYIKKYEGMKKGEIVKIFKQQLAKAGGKLIK
jgi:hypothetical protein|tara:strand:- start:824 stop:1099 length:276 start_codon:yes stop_codon:yes gene_type:complete